MSHQQHQVTSLITFNKQTSNKNKSLYMIGRISFISSNDVSQDITRMHRITISYHGETYKEFLNDVIPFIE